MSFDMYMYDTLTLPINPERMHTHRPEEINAKAKNSQKRYRSMAMTELWVDTR